MKLLVSVRSVDEARQAVEGGADFIDLKEPRLGALGALPLATIGSCVAALRPFEVPISATIGDVPMSPLDDIAERVQAVADCGVDYVKVGIERNAAAHDVLTMLAACRRPVVPVLLVDRGLDTALITHAAGLRFAGLMLDTADKQAGSLFDCVPTSTLRQFIATAHAASMMCGLAGALRIEDLPQLLALGPDFAGFRTAVCSGDRRGALDADRLRALRQAVSPISRERTESSALL